MTSSRNPRGDNDRIHGGLDAFANVGLGVADDTTTAEDEHRDWDEWGRGAAHDSDNDADGDGDAA